MKRIRILVAELPSLMLDVLHHVVGSEPDMAIVGVVNDGDVLAATRRARADLVIIGQRPDDGHEDYAQLLLRQPRLKVLAIATTGGTGSLYELRPQRITLGDISARSLTNAIRGRAPVDPGAGSRGENRWRSSDAGRT